MSCLQYRVLGLESLVSKEAKAKKLMLEGRDLDLENGLGSAAVIVEVKKNPEVPLHQPMEA